MLEVTPIALLSDNYAYLLRSDGVVAVVDPSEAQPIIDALGDEPLQYVFNTHHHWDHTGGNEALKAHYGCEVIGPKGDENRVKLDRQMGDGDRVEVGQSNAQVIGVPGHTLPHVALWFEEAGMVFTGDTLFLMGCGRLFEGTPKQMWNSLTKLRALPDETKIYCGHEYTEANLRFARSLEPESTALAARQGEVDERRRAGLPTVPGNIGQEKETNPFFRADVSQFQQSAGYGGSAWEVFAQTRQAKDHF